MIKLLLLPLFFLLASRLQAQNPDYPAYRHSLGIGFERVGLDAPDAIGNRYLVRYARHFRQDRIALINGFGYVNALNRRYLPGVNDYYVTGQPRERLTADVTLAFDFIKQPRHAFRVGVGPSVWYRKDELVQTLRWTQNSNGTVSNVQVEWQPLLKELNYGYNVLVEYEYALTPQLTVSPTLKFASLERAGQSAIYGVGVGYRLR